MRMWHILGRNLLLAVLLLIAGCAGDEITDPVDYLSWIGDPKHGLVKSHALQGVTFTMRYLSPEYRALQEIRGTNADAALRDSVLRRCSNSVAFLLSIAANADTQSMSGPASPGVDGSVSVVDQTQSLQFDIQSKVEVRAGNRSFRPVLATLDNDHGLNPTRNITLAFVDDSKTNALQHARTYDVVFNDDIYNTGVSTFSFDSVDIASRVRFDIQRYQE